MYLNSFLTVVLDGHTDCHYACAKSKENVFVQAWKGIVDTHTHTHPYLPVKVFCYKPEVALGFPGG
jgi:hypothetical protein